MGEGTGRYLAPATRARVPSVLFSVEVHCESESKHRRREYVTSRFKEASVTCTKRYRGRWTAPEVARVGSGEALRSWMEERASTHRTNWVVADCASDVLTLSGFWAYAEERGITWNGMSQSERTGAARTSSNGAVDFSRLVLSRAPDIVRYRVGGNLWQWVSGRNYLADGPGELGMADDQDGSYVRVDGRRVPRSGTWTADGALRWSLAIRRLMDWWSDHAKAPWGPTAGALAVSMLRTHAPPRVLSTHNHADVHQLERRAAFGGRATTWFFGSVGDGTGEKCVGRDALGEEVEQREEGPVTLLDVRNMYPALLRDQLFPCRYIGREVGCSAEKLVALSRDFGIVADVLIRTEVGEYPTRHRERIVYPVGQFATTLTGAELLTCTTTTEIVNVGTVAVYAMGKPFAQCSAALLELCTSARDAAACATASVAKLIANSLGGKLAQRSGGWVRTPKLDEPGRWGMSYDVNAQTGDVTRYRYVAGLCWRWEDDRDGKGPYTAAFAYLAAYGRLMMRRYRERCPPRSVVSQDTDGLWVLPPALAALGAPLPKLQCAPGTLGVDRAARRARWYGPRHYYTDGVWTLSGFSEGRMEGDGRSVSSVVRESLWSSRVPHAPTETRLVNRLSVLKRECPGMVVGADGWASPIRADKL